VKRAPAAIVTGTDGMALTRAKPLITESEWGRLQRALDDASRKRTRRLTPSLLLDVAYCAECGSKLYYGGHETTKYGDYRYYRCRQAQTAASPERPPCASGRSSALNLDDLAERQFLAIAGDQQVMEREFVPGEDHTEELALVRGNLAHVRDEFDMGRYA
jgi:site-specific DNA recombinase